eukprot:2012161-Amphidinium_carterae.1
MKALNINFKRATLPGTTQKRRSGTRDKLSSIGKLLFQSYDTCSWHPHATFVKRSGSFLAKTCFGSSRSLPLPAYHSLATRRSRRHCQAFSSLMVAMVLRCMTDCRQALHAILYSTAPCGAVDVLQPHRTA